ncbi:hypothetical protein [Paenibacillus sp. JNUCC31]|uniref:hypothetical protein n=1 Tax=Paenibacillus sp. JNUCC-31 TaxID=2777983 RepID=UPI001E61A33E|nr:hypothetical protein [Paenibacillus sp. JNUCC-31]
MNSRQKAAIMVTHDERMLEYCDKVYRMEDGKLSFQLGIGQRIRIQQETSSI